MTLCILFWKIYFECRQGLKLNWFNQFDWMQGYTDLPRLKVLVKDEGHDCHDVRRGTCIYKT